MKKVPEILMARDTLFLLLQHLSFEIKQIEFLGLVIDTEKMTFVLSEKKLKHVSQQCQ